MDYRTLVNKNIVWEDGILGLKQGVINAVNSKDNNVFVYAMFFGKNVWLSVDDMGKKWNIVEPYE